MTVKGQAVGLLAWLLIVFAVAIVGGVATSGAGDFYRQLDLPSWAPPAGLFAPVWGVLYLLMAIAAWLVWRVRSFAGARNAFALFFAQLLANAAWTWLFFALRQGAWAFAEILILWILLGSTLIVFWRIRPLAGALLLPYLAWVTFAAALALVAWQRNSQLLS